VSIPPPTPQAAPHVPGWRLGSIPLARTPFLGALLLAPLLSGCGNEDALQGAAAQPVPVLVQEVTYLERPEYVALSGDVEPRRSAHVGFLVGGVVSSVGPSEGDAVQAGDLLAELDSTEYRLNLDMAAAQRARAQDAHRRAEIVYAEDGLPESDFHEAQTALQVARAQEGLARKKLTDTRLTAPISGVVAMRGIQPGEQAGPGRPVFTIVQVTPAQVSVGVPEADIGRVAVGQRAEVTVPALEGARFEGRVRLVGIAADPASRTYSVKVELPNPERRLRPGMIAEVRIDTDDLINTVTIPGEAVVRDADGVTHVFVYFPEEERVHRRRVEVGSAYGNEVEIEEGLEGDEMVVVGGQTRVREGSRVSASTAAEDPPPAAASDEGSTAPGSL